MEQIRQILNTRKVELVERFDVASLALFGSFARGDSNEVSDIDLLVEFRHPTRYRNYIRLKYYLEELLGKRIDLVTKQGLKPWVRSYVEKELVRVA